MLGGASSSAEDKVMYSSDHDLVVGELAALLQRQKIKTGNDTESELFTVDPSENRIYHIFEVLTDTKEKDVLAAVAKLILQTSAAALNPMPVLVLPEEKMNHYEQEFRRINISIIGFHWQEERVVFSGLEKIHY